MTEVVRVGDRASRTRTVTRRDIELLITDQDGVVVLDSTALVSRALPPQTSVTG